MTKQEKIKEAYGRFYKPNIHHYSINGWVNLNEWTEDEVGKLIDEIGMEFREHSARPKSLQGIETNNGWNVLKGIKNEIQHDGDIWIVNKHGGIELWLEHQFLPIGYATHWKPVIEPKPPIY